MKPTVKFTPGGSMMNNVLNNQDFAKPKIPENKKKYCRFRRYGIKYIDYKDPNFLLKFLNDQGKVLPRRITGNSIKFQKKVSVAIKRARLLALLPYVADSLK